MLPTSLRSKQNHGDSAPQQEVRFKLDDAQQQKEKSEAERESTGEKSERRKDVSLGSGRERRSSRQNVAMQVCFSFKFIESKVPYS